MSTPQHCDGPEKDSEMAAHCHDPALRRDETMAERAIPRQRPTPRQHVRSCAVVQGPLACSSMAPDLHAGITQCLRSSRRRFSTRSSCQSVLDNGFLQGCLVNEPLSLVAEILKADDRCREKHVSLKHSTSWKQSLCLVNAA